MNKLETFNARLKASKLGTRIEQRGDRLYIVATLPPKPNSDRSDNHQQRIALHKLANHEGLSYAYDQAKLIGGQIATNTFIWNDWLESPKIDLKTIGEWIDAARSYYLNQGGRLETWEGEYQKAYKRLPVDSPLNIRNLHLLLYSTEPNTRTRRRYALAFAYLCDFAGIEHDFRELTGNYSPTAVSPRDIPTDELISYWQDSLRNHKAWQWTYGMMAVYGLRNHEVMFCDLDNFPICYVFRGKSKQERYTYPLYPEWAENWRLFEINRPKISGRTHSDLGNRISKAFSRYGIPFAPYNLRHAWARRSIDFGYDPSLAASLMGHGLDVHSRIYQLWLTRETYDRAYERILNDPNRPKPP